MHKLRRKLLVHKACHLAEFSHKGHKRNPQAYGRHALQAVSAMACSPSAQYPPTLAVAMRANKRNVRIMVYQVLVGADAGSPFGSSALCISQANIAEALSIKVCYPCTLQWHM